MTLSNLLDATSQKASFFLPFKFFLRLIMHRQALDWLLHVFSSIVYFYQNWIHFFFKLIVKFCGLQNHYTTWDWHNDPQRPRASFCPIGLFCWLFFTNNFSFPILDFYGLYGVIILNLGFSVVPRTCRHWVPEIGWWSFSAGRKCLKGGSDVFKEGFWLRRRELDIWTEMLWHLSIWLFKMNFKLSPLFIHTVYLRLW